MKVTKSPSLKIGFIFFFVNIKEQATSWDFVFCVYRIKEYDFYKIFIALLFKNIRFYKLFILLLTITVNFIRFCFKPIWCQLIKSQVIRKSCLFTFVPTSMRHPMMIQSTLAMIYQGWFAYYNSTRRLLWNFSLASCNKTTPETNLFKRRACKPPCHKGDFNYAGLDWPEITLVSHPMRINR